MFYETSLFGGVRPGALLFSEGKGTMFKPPGVRLWVGLLEVNAHLRVRQESLSKNAEDSWGGGGCLVVSRVQLGEKPVVVCM